MKRYVIRPSSASRPTDRAGGLSRHVEWRRQSEAGRQEDIDRMIDAKVEQAARILLEPIPEDGRGA